MYTPALYADCVNALLKGDVIPAVDLESESKPESLKSICPSKYSTLELSGKIPWFSQLFDSFSEAFRKGLVLDLIVHGSYGDLSFNHFSDLEITVVVPDAVLRNLHLSRHFSQWVKKVLNPLILKIDPLQHHGAFFLWPSLVANYDERILPVCAYQNSWSMSGESFSCNIKNNHESFVFLSKKRYELTLNYLLNCQEHFFSKGENLYSLKRFLSNLFMLPVFYYQSQGDYLSKKAAFHRIYNEKKQYLLTPVLRKASSFRDVWPGSHNWMSRWRCLWVREKIPQNVCDLWAVNLFRHSDVSKSIDYVFLDEVRRACEEELKRLHETR